MILLFCGLSGAGKTTLAESVQKRLVQLSIPVEVIDADQYRSRLFSDLGFSRRDRMENIRRLGFIANKFASHGIVSIVSAINPYEEVRRELIARYRDVKVAHIDCPLDELKRRDTKGLYLRAALPDDAPGKLHCLSGVNDPFEAPVSPDLYFNTRHSGIDECTRLICSYLIGRVSPAQRNRAWHGQ
ncbi:MAG TPA: adenylyl-sulfate kinase [Janthinobacterium sp.]|nr:adenylyl-sulfate kinase [Janthinobacterium sp.]